MTRILTIIALLILTSPVSAFDRIINIIGDGSDLTHVSYIMKRCGIINLSMAENFKVRGKAAESTIVEMLDQRALTFITYGRTLELSNSKGVTDEQHQNQLALIGKMYVAEMERSWSKTGNKISDNIQSDLASCTELHKMFEE